MQRSDTYISFKCRIVSTYFTVKYKFKFDLNVFPQKPVSIPSRIWIGCMAFAVTAMAYIYQSNMPIALLAMAKSDNETQPDVSIFTRIIKSSKSHTQLYNEQFGPRYSYTPYEQSLILGVYYIGGTLSGIPTGLMLDSFNCVRWYILSGCLVAGILSALIPSMAWSAPMLIVVRLVLGIMSIGTYPAMHKMFSMWSPVNELGKFTSTLTGSNFGSIFILSTSGVVTETFGWQYSFYLTTIACLLFCTAWWFIGYESPAAHPRIKASERAYIEESRKEVTELRPVSITPTTASGD